MEEYPEVDSKYFTERAGVLRVASEVNSLGFVFRETPNKDVGIDAQIEYANSEGKAIGKLVAAQIKSGDSYVHDKGNYWVVYPQEKHKNYWESFPIPVILFVYSPKNNQIYFTDARQQLNNPQKKNSYIEIPKENIFTISSRDSIFQNIGNFNSPFLDLHDVLRLMMVNRCSNPTFSVSYFDLFINGISNIGRQLYFSMSLASDIADHYNKTEYGIAVGETEHNFLHGYARFLISQNLARVDYADYLIDWTERMLQPTFLAPLTQRGRDLLKYISEQHVQKRKNSKVNLISERLIRMPFSLWEYPRLDEGLKFSKEFLESS
jgi:hypothetical protein